MNATSTGTVVFSKTTRATLLAGDGEVGMTCQVAFTYGLETNPLVTAEFLKKLTFQSRHAHIAPHTSSLKTAKNLIPLKVVTDAFSRMPKLSAAHKDGWTWELLRDAVSRPSTSAVLRQFTEFFYNGALLKDLWTSIASTLVYLFHKQLPEE